MYHDIGEHKFNNTFYKREIRESDYYIIIKDGKLMANISDDGILNLPSVKKEGIRKARFLFCIDEVGFYQLEKKIEGYQEVIMCQLRSTTPKWLRFGALEGYRLAKWYNDNHYCGKCGKELVEDEKERMLRCPNCGNMIFPKICPVAIVGIINGERILLTKYANNMNSKNYALVAGFCEFGETIEDTIKREVKEETGLEVKNIRYYGSQPWPFSEALIFGFYCELDGCDEVSFNDHELGASKWALPEEIDEGESESITAELIENFKKHGRKVLEM